MEIDVGGLIAISIFYLVIFAIGIWAAWSRRTKAKGTDETMLAGRSIGTFVGILTLTATWVGGGYINGSAEAIYDSGLVWCQAPFGYSISLVLGGLFFARKMRDAGYVTMLDPLQELFGMRWGSMLVFPAIAGELLWSSGILAALGTTLAVMLHLDSTVSIIVSAGIAVSYTLFGGLAAVAYTDVVQLFCIFIGLWISIPFALTHENAGSISLEHTDWIGSTEGWTFEWGEWIDYYLLLIFGGIPWQAYYQRILSARTSKQAQLMSIAAGFGCIVMVVPACIIGAIARETNWEATLFNRTINEDEKSMVLPLVIHYLTPTWVSYLGLGAVSAAVMSSADSSILSSSSLFARNLYKNVFRVKASEREQVIVMRVAVVAFSILSCWIAINVESVYQLFYLCGDLVYVMLFPQLALAVHAPSYVNVYGSVTAYFLGFLLRILGGERVIGLPAVIKFPWYDEESGRQHFPFRTLAMVLSIISMLLVSWLSRKLIGGKNRLNISEKPGGTKSKDENGIDNVAMTKSNSNDGRLPSYDSALELSTCNVPQKQKEYYT